MAADGATEAEAGVGPVRVLIVGGPPWSEAINQTATQMATALADLGHDVTYLCRPRQSSWLRGVEGRRRGRRTSDSADGVRVEYLTGIAELLPMTAPGIRFLQLRLLRRAVWALERRNGPYDLTLLYWWFFPELVRDLPGVVLYDAVDEHHAYPMNAGRTRHNARTLVWEGRTAGAAAGVAAVSEASVHRLRAHHAGVRWLPNGIDLNRLAGLRVQLNAVQTVPSRVGYGGGVGPRVDWELIRFLADARPQYEFSFAGGGSHPSDLPANVQFLGAATYTEVLRHIASSAVTVVPFVDDDFTRGSDFLKAYDYLAVGKVVVATKLPALGRLWELFPAHVRLPQDRDEWLCDLDEVLSRKDARPAPDVSSLSTNVRARALLALGRQRGRASNGARREDSDRRNQPPDQAN